MYSQLKLVMLIKVVVDNQITACLVKPLNWAKIKFEDTFFTYINETDDLKCQR